MIFSYTWLNNFFDGKLPAPEKLADILTNNIAEVDSWEKNEKGEGVLDVKIIPNLAHSCLAHRGLARFLGAKLDLPVNKTSRKFADFKTDKVKTKLEIEIENPADCRRYIGRVIENIKIGPSPIWLKEALENIGQRSINNVVDATNFVMLELGQPLHAFDADKLVRRDETIKIEIKRVSPEIQFTTLDGKTVLLDDSILAITNESRPLAIAGIKGGTEAEITEETSRLVLESASFDPVLIRKTSQKIKIATDASKRYENDYSPEMAEEAMELLTKIILEVAGTSATRIDEVVDNYPRRANAYKVGVSGNEARSVLGVEISDEQIADIFRRFNFVYQKVAPVNEVLRLAPTLIGASYRAGASVTFDAPKEFDCSGFVAYLYVQAGIALPRVSIDQFVFAKPVAEKDLQAGDLIFANSGDGQVRTETVEFLHGTKVEKGVDHVGLYLGDGKVIHSTRYKNGVVMEELAKSEQFVNIVGYGRVSDNTERFVVTAPVERLDLRLKQDLIEDIGMIYGYDKIQNKEMSRDGFTPVINKKHYYSDRLREILGGLGFSEIYTYAFASKGEIELLNPINSELPYLRTNLTDGVNKSLEFNARQAELIGMPQIKIFEIGETFKPEAETTNFALGVKTPVGVKLPEKDSAVLTKALEEIKKAFNLTDLAGKISTAGDVWEVNLDELLAKLPEPAKEDVVLAVAPADMKFKKISSYPFMVRDIAIFVPETTTEEQVSKLIVSEATNLLIRIRLFDVFTKNFPDGTAKTSYAYRLVFQSYEKTLVAEEVDKIMAGISAKVTGEGWIVR